MLASFLSIDKLAYIYPNANPVKATLEVNLVTMAYWENFKMCRMPLTELLVRDYATMIFMLRM